MSSETNNPGEAAAQAAGETPQPPVEPGSPAKKPLSKVTMRVSLKAPTPGAGPAAIAPDPRKDVVLDAPVEPAAPAQPMAAPLNIQPVLGAGAAPAQPAHAPGPAAAQIPVAAAAVAPQFASMDQATANPAPTLQPTAVPGQTPQQSQQPVGLAQKPKKDKSTVLLNAALIILGLVAVALLVVMFMSE